MREIPIIFSAPMVRALLAGTKTQTRRLVKGARAPYGGAGDRLWVREGFVATEDGFRYRADEPLSAGRWSSPLHMPRVACRLLLDISAVRTEALQAIDDSDSIAEGVASKDAYAKQWDLINPHHPWSTDPRVWVVTFSVRAGG